MRKTGPNQRTNQGDPNPNQLAKSRERLRQANCIVSAVLRVRPIVARVLRPGHQAAAFRC
jgi:hypothetical protein